VIGAAFAVATVVTSPGASAQLPAIPQTLNGTTAEITVDGEPYDGTTPIEVLDQDGAALGTADVANGVWVFRVNEGPSETVIRIGLAVTDPVPFARGALTTVVITAVTPPLVVTTTVSLSAGFQALTHTGGALPIDDFLALFDSSEAVSGVFVWDRSVGNLASWRRGLPAPLQGVTQIGENTALLLSLDSAATYESEVVGHEAGTHALDAGFTAVPFNGPDGTSVADGIAAIVAADGVSAIFRFNNGTGSYDSFRAALPPMLNSLMEFNRGDVLLVPSGAATTWTYDAFTLE